MKDAIAGGTNFNFRRKVKGNSMLKELLSALVIASTMATVAVAEPQEVKSMKDPQTGDHWTYAQRDEITGQASGTFTQTVTEARDDEVSVRLTVQGKPPGLMIFDRQWNLKDTITSRFLPNEGFGIKTPLAVGQTWTAEAQMTSMKGEPTGVSFSRTVRVVGQGMVTTRAGRFDAFEIEYNTRNANSDTSAVQVEGAVRMWYAPEINHWVKRAKERRMNGRLMAKETEELTEYGRRESN